MDTSIRGNEKDVDKCRVGGGSDGDATIIIHLHCWHGATQVPTPQKKTVIHTPTGINITFEPFHRQTCFHCHLHIRTVLIIESTCYRVKVPGELTLVDQ